MSRSVIILLIISVLSCKSAEKAFEEGLAQQSATWTTWNGGQPGVGGNTYAIEISVPKHESLKAQNFTVDGRAIEITSQKVENDLLIVAAMENTSSTQPVIGSTGEPKPKFREKDPENATIELVSDCCSTTFVLSDFKKTKGIKTQ